MCRLDSTIIGEFLTAACCASLLAADTYYSLWRIELAFYLPPPAY